MSPSAWWSTVGQSVLTAQGVSRRASLTDYYPAVYSIVAFRYGRLMTVPGKGGRPRKWRSDDADRGRAFRARQRGEEEPTTFDDALADGDELARAIDRARQLQADLVAAIESLGEAQAALAAERRRHRATQRMLDQTRATLGERHEADSRRAEELRVTLDELRAATAENRRLRAQLTLAQQAGGPNRAARRQAAKKDRRTER